MDMEAPSTCRKDPAEGPPSKVLAASCSFPTTVVKRSILGPELVICSEESMSKRIPGFPRFGQWNMLAQELGVKRTATVVIDDKPSSVKLRIIFTCLASPSAS